MQTRTITGITIALILSLALAQAVGLGVSPATLEFEDALKGVMTEKYFTIQNPGNDTLSCSLELTGDVSGWIELAPQGDIDIPSRGKTEITVMLTPPESADNGEYTGKAKVRAQYKSAVEGTGMGLLPGVDADIVATITDEEIMAGEVSKILTKDEDYGDPVKFTIGFRNRGNVPCSPEVQIVIKKAGDAIDTEEQELMSLAPGASRDYVLEWSTTEQEAGKYYTATVTVSLDGKVLKEKDVGFTITGNNPSYTGSAPLKYEDYHKEVTGEPEKLGEAAESEKKVDLPVVLGLVILIFALIAALTYVLK